VSTSRSVPDVPSTAATAGALKATRVVFPATATPQILALIEAAETLAKGSIQILPRAPFTSPFRETAICAECKRGRTYQGFVHAESCMVGKVLASANAVRGSAVTLTQFSREDDDAHMDAQGGMGSAPAPPRLPSRLCQMPSPDGKGRCVRAKGHLGTHEDPWTSQAWGADLGVGSDLTSPVESICGMTPGCILRAGHELPCSPPFVPVQARNPVPEDDLASPVESDESWEASAAILAARAREHRVVCGAHFLGEHAPDHPLTCDKEPGHDADPLSDHWNRDARRSWPTAALIAAEAAR
jgi:hypothetical protein